MKIASWNVNGIRAISKKEFDKPVAAINADMICFQETKATPDQVKEAVKDLIKGYDIVADSAEKKGYSGTGIFYKKKPLNVSYGIGIEQHDKEGRVITLEYDNFYLVTVYTPNSGSALKRLSYRQQWDKDFLAFLQKLEKSKPVVVCGDLNVAHKDIDLKNNKPNYNKSAGYMQQEIDGLDNYIKAGFIDTFRFLHPDTVKYSWWSYRGGARDRNVGWRIDYFLISGSLKNKLQKAEIHNDAFGSDHCAVSIEIDL
ncbi:MAG: exodeoxyribonuclease-3 [Saprospiraceae bacterium]|jgi:exodeoxyribonuclease-3